MYCYSPAICNESAISTVILTESGLDVIVRNIAEVPFKGREYGFIFRRVVRNANRILKLCAEVTSRRGTL